MLEAYGGAEQSIASQELVAQLKNLRDQVELDFLIEDIPMLIKESKDGIARVGQIVKDLKDFSRVDSSQEWQLANLQQGMDSTLNIVANEIKYKADVVKQYTPLPEVECLPSQINQVIMNLIVNAAQAIGPERGTITLRNGVEGDNVWIEVADNGSGMPPETLQKIFDPFFTTKPVGQGTGLGLSLSYGIVKKHHGEITVSSEVGVGTTFRIELPMRQLKQAV
ncbi:ATP-binding protein [Pseudomonas brassicacearum]